VLDQVAGGMAGARPSTFARHTGPDTTKGRKGLPNARPDGVRKELQSLVDVVEEMQLDDTDPTPHLAGVLSAVNTLCARLLPQPASFGPPSHGIPLQPLNGAPLLAPARPLPDLLAPVRAPVLANKLCTILAACATLVVPQISPSDR
jgi:hypothetical protein